MNTDICVSYRDKVNHLKAPLGAEKLREKYGFGQKRIAEVSYCKYKRTKSNDYITPDTIFKENIVELDRVFSNGELPWALPVSVSKYNVLAEFEDRIKIFQGLDSYNQNQQFPCHSGDWTGNETPPFMKRLAFNIGGKDYVSRRANELIEVICTFQFPLSLSQKCNSISNSQPLLAYFSSPRS